MLFFFFEVILIAGFPMGTIKRTVTWIQIRILIAFGTTKALTLRTVVCSLSVFMQTLWLLCCDVMSASATSMCLLPFLH